MHCKINPFLPFHQMKTNVIKLYEITEKLVIKKRIEQCICMYVCPHKSNYGNLKNIVKSKQIIILCALFVIAGAHVGQIFSLYNMSNKRVIVCKSRGTL